MMKIQPWQLAQKQALPLDCKIQLSELRIRQWYSHWQGQVYVSFSGGKDSTVLLHLVRSIYPDVPAVFIDTGLEFPEIREFVKNTDNVTWIKPKMTFRKVLDHYGYPVVSKEVAQKLQELRVTKSEKLRKKRLYGDEKGNGKLSDKWHFLIDAPFKISHECCFVMKKRPVKRYEKESGRKPFVGIMAADSRNRETSYMRTGCNSFDATRPMSRPLSVWCEKDIWGYIKSKGIPYSSIYDKGYSGTGCVFCAFGCNRDVDKGRKNKFQQMKETHPKLWSYCVDKLKMREILDFVGVPVD